MKRILIAVFLLTSQWIWASESDSSEASFGDQNLTKPQKILFKKALESLAKPDMAVLSDLLDQHEFLLDQKTSIQHRAEKPYKSNLS